MRIELRQVGLWALLAGSCAALWIMASAQSPPSDAESSRLQEIRNLGKAFYETPGSSQQAVEQLAEALDLNPDSAQEHLNYGLALLRAGQLPQHLGLPWIRTLRQHHAVHRRRQGGAQEGAQIAGILNVIQGQKKPGLPGPWRLGQQGCGHHPVGMDRCGHRRQHPLADGLLETGRDLRQQGGMILAPALGEDQPLEGQAMTQGLFHHVGPLQQHHPRLTPATGRVQLPQLFHQGIPPAGDQWVALSIVCQWWWALHSRQWDANLS